MTTKPFFAAEIGLYQPGGSDSTFEFTFGAAPFGALDLDLSALESTGLLRVSDDGYTTLASDTGGVVVFPPIMNQAFAIDRQMRLPPHEAAAAWAFGSITLSDPDGSIASLMRTWNIIGQTVAVYRGEKDFDFDRGLWVCPSYDDLVPVFTGMADQWVQGEQEITIPLRDASFWLEKPIQATVYGGTGGYEGPATSTGKTVPMTRGKAYNVTPELIDDVNLIYQYNDAAGSVVALYERGATGILFESDTSDLYSGSTTAGKYRTDDSRGLFQLGSAPAGAITCTVTGEFPTAGDMTVLADIAQYLTSEDAAVPADFIDTASFDDVASDYPIDGGIYIGAGQQVDGVTAISNAIEGAAFKLIAGRNGKLKLFPLRALADDAIQDAALGIYNVISVKPVALPDALRVPTFRVRAGYQRNYTVQNDLSSSATAAQIQFAAADVRYQPWYGASVEAAYRRTNELPPFGGSTDDSADAQDVADAMGALWGTSRRLYAIEVPMEVGINLDLGSVVYATLPVDALRNGARGQIVGEQFRSQGNITFLVLV